MILHALTRYYEDLLSRGEIAAPGWSPAKISYALCLNGAGDLEQVIPTMEEVTKGKKTALQPQTFSLPAAVKRTVGIDANFLWDNSSYLLGVDQKGKPERSRDCFAAAAQKHHAVLDGVDSPIARAILAFFDTWQPEHAAEHLRQHAGRELIVGDDAVLQRVHGDDIAGRAPEHVPRGRADLQHLAAVFIEGDDGRLAQHDAAPGRIDQHVGRAEIDPKVSGKE